MAYLTLEPQGQLCEGEPSATGTNWLSVDDPKEPVAHVVSTDRFTLEATIR